MSVHDKVRHKGDEVKGNAKESLGRLTGNESLETEGKAEKWAAKAKGAVDEAVDDLTHEESRHKPGKRE